MGDIVGRLFREFAVTLVRHHPRLGRCLAHPHPYDGRQAPPPHAGVAAGRLLQKVRRVLRVRHRPLRQRRPLRPPPPGAHAARHPRHLRPHVFLYIIVPKGFFPVQDTGVILAITEAAQTISFAAMAERQTALARNDPARPRRRSLSSFIGIDATNTTLNSGRIQINLKDAKSAPPSALDVIARLQPKVDRRRRHPDLSAALAGPHRRRPRQPHRIPVLR